MKRQEKLEIIRREMLQAFPHPEVPLQHFDAYSLLVAVALSAQCTDARVNLVTPELFRLAPSVQEMALCAPETLEACIASCGMAKTKAARLVRMAQMIVEHFGGHVPESFEELESLPGIGHKTASVVMHQAFGHDAFPVDTHIYRLARRWGLSRGTNVIKVEEDLKKAFAPSEWGAVHLQMVLWGRAFCPARGCKPTCRICSALGREDGE